LATPIFYTENNPAVFLS